MARRLRQILGVVGAVVITVAVAAGSAAAAVYAAGPNGLISCVPPTPPAPADVIPRWLLMAGAPAAVTILVGAFFALAAERVLFRMIGLLVVIALGLATSYAVYLNLPAECLP